MAKAAIIGCGMIAGRLEVFAPPRTYSHAKAYTENPAFDGLALYDRSPEHAMALAAKVNAANTNAAVFDSIEDMLTRFKPDVVSVCTPDDHHFAALCALLTHTQGPALILCEKPICGTRKEFKSICDMERASRTRVIVNHSRRFDPAHQCLKQRISSDEFGALVLAHVIYYGGWRHLGVHIVDILQFFFDRNFEPRQVSFCCPSKYADDPTLDVFGTLGTAAVRLSGFPEAFFQIVDISLLMERGQIRIGDFGQSIDVFRKTVNAEGENVLVRDEAASGRGMVDPMVNAVAVAARYIDKRDPALLEPFGLVQAGITMETLWQGDDLFALET